MKIKKSNFSMKRFNFINTFKIYFYLNNVFLCSLICEQGHYNAGTVSGL